MTMHPPAPPNRRVRELPGAWTWMTVSQHPQITVVVYDKDGTENHWSGLNPGGIEQIIAIESHGAEA